MKMSPPPTKKKPGADYDKIPDLPRNEAAGWPSPLHLQAVEMMLSAQRKIKKLQREEAVHIRPAWGRLHHFGTGGVRAGRWSKVPRIGKPIDSQEDQTRSIDTS